MKRDGLAESAAARWTRAEDYLGAMGRERSARRRRTANERNRTEPEAPRLLLSTIPFVVLISLLGMLAMFIMIAAVPHSEAPAPPKQVAAKEVGVAARGWFQEAEKEFHR